MKRIFFKGLLALGAGLFFTACGGSSSSVNADRVQSYTAGTLSIAADESFKPVIAQEVKVFDSSYPEASLSVNYFAERDCLQKLLDGEVQMAFTSRPLTAEEKRLCKEREIFTKELAIAKDGIVILVNNKSQDFKMTTGMVEAILKGEFARKYNVVIDNQNGSIARFIKDSILRGAPISGSLYAANNSEEVIKYVAENENALGFVGMTHAFDPTAQEGYGTFRKEVTVVSLHNDSLNKFVLPYQATIALNEYPYVRRLYFIARIESGLASGFANFLTSEPGQLIINKSRMLPLNVPLEIREAEIKP